jgi:hypothetical protein
VIYSELENITEPHQTGLSKKYVVPLAMVQEPTLVQVHEKRNIKNRLD